MTIRSLTRVEEGWARAALGAMFPGGAHPRLPHGAEAVDTVARFNEICESVPARVAFGLRAALWMIALAPVVVLLRLRTIAGLDAPAREKVVCALLASRVYLVRQLTLLLKAFGALFFVSSPEVRAAIVGDAPALVTLGKKEVRRERSVA